MQTLQARKRVLRLLLDDHAGQSIVPDLPLTHHRNYPNKHFRSSDRSLVVIDHPPQPYLSNIVEARKSDSMSQKIKFTSKQADLPNLNFGINVKNFGSVSSDREPECISADKTRLL